MKDAEIPRKAGTKHTRYDASEQGQERRKRYRNSRTSQRHSDYLTRPFIAWDGEGINEADGSHTYVLLANSLGAKLVRRTGISTREAFDMFLDAPTDNVIHAIFGGNYDVNMILRDLSRDDLDRLYHDGHVTWGEYFIDWKGSKSFTVSRNGRRFTLFDVWPFFQKSFVAACDEYLGKGWPYRNEIIREKGNRGKFVFESIESIGQYNAAELSTLVLLCGELRQRLSRVNIRVSRWDGPGAIAAALYQKYNIKHHLRQSPTTVATAARYAYAGGRFEIIRKGHSEGRSYQYDIRSAYPNAIRYLPCLTHGKWRHVTGPITAVSRFGVYRIETTESLTDSVTQPQPLWMRNKDGTVFWNECAHGWYWTPEAQIALELGATIHEGWVLEKHCDCDPFSFVEPLYLKRAALKRAGDGAHVGLKLGLNSLYGKLAQQIGWEPGPPLKLPPYHSLEWAGFVTSHCRAKIYRAAMLAIDDVIAFETDAIFTRAPLPLDLGDGLGEWELTEYESLTYLKSGMYFGTFKGGKKVEKMRGVNKGSLTRESMIAGIESDEITPILKAKETRFITLGKALHQDFTKWRKWFTADREIKVLLSGKRIDLIDRYDERAMQDDGWQETEPGYTETEFSYPYEVEWIEATAIENDDGQNLSEIRLENSHSEVD